MTGQRREIHEDTGRTSEGNFFNASPAKGVSPNIAQRCAENFVESSLDGVYSHGVNRFARVIRYLDQGVIAKEAEPVCGRIWGSGTLGWKYGHG